MNLRVLVAVVAVALLVPTLVSAAAKPKRPKDYANVALNILPPGEGADGGPNSTDQLALYDGLTPLWNAVTPTNFRNYFKSESFGVQGNVVRVESTGRKGVRIARDRWGVAHVTGKTRDDAMFGSGWVTAEDRNLLLQLIRAPSRAAALDIPGIDPFALALSGRTFVPSPEAEAALDAQLDLLRNAGAKGKRILKDVDAYVAGVNAYLRSTGLQISPWTRNDVIAAGSLIGAIFGVAGGDEVRRSEFLDALQKRLGATEGRAMWDDLRAARTSDSPVSLPGTFPLGEASPEPLPGNASVDDGSFQPFEPGGAKLARHVERSMSNAILIGAKRSASHHPIMVAGPQVGYFWPEFFLELDLHGGGIDARGAVFPGVPWVVIGRGKDYAWSAMSSHSDLVDQFVEILCGGDDLHYRFEGECREMRTFDAGVLRESAGQADQRLVIHMTVHGPVVGYAHMNGQPVAISSERSTRGREVESGRAFADLNANKVRSASDFFKVINQEEFAFNWVYVDNRDIAMFSAGRLPHRAADVDVGLPTMGTGDFEWQGVEPLAAHPRAINPSSGAILAWNNRPAREYAAADDDWGWGSVHRQQLLQVALARKNVTPAFIVGAMNQAATQDLRVVLVWPVIRGMLDRVDAPSGRASQLVATLDSWLGRGGSRLDGDLDGKIDDPGAAIMDAAWPRIADAVMSPRLGPLTDRLAQLIPRDHPPGPQGSAFESGWYGYVQRDLAEGTPTYCGAGDVQACAHSLWAALEAAGDELAAAEGVDPAAWRADATKERIRFRPGLLGETMRWTNRPTFQQVISYARHRPR